MPISGDRKVRAARRLKFQELNFHLLSLMVPLDDDDSLHGVELFFNWIMFE